MVEFVEAEAEVQNVKNKSPSFFVGGGGKGKQKKHFDWLTPNTNSLIVKKTLTHSQ